MRLYGAFGRIGKRKKVKLGNEKEENGEKKMTDCQVIQPLDIIFFLLAYAWVRVTSEVDRY